MIEYEKLIHMVSESMLQLTFNQLLLVEFWHRIREGYLKKPIKYFFFLFLQFVFVRQGFLHISTKTAYIKIN